MIQVVQCACGESHMTKEGLCVKCGKDREEGRGKRMVEHFMDTFKALRDDQKTEAIRALVRWLNL